MTDVGIALATGCDCPQYPAEVERDCCCIGGTECIDGKKRPPSTSEGMAGGSPAVTAVTQVGAPEPRDTDRGPEVEATGDASDPWSHGSPVSVQTMQAAIADQICPWCHKGPFRILLAHLAKYGVDRYQARDMAEMPKTAKGLTDIFVRDKMSTARRLRPRPTGLRNGSPKGERRSYSLGGRLAQAAKTIKDPEHFAEMSRHSRDAEARRRIDVAIRFLEANGYTVTGPEPKP